MRWKTWMWFQRDREQREEEEEEEEGEKTSIANAQMNYWCNRSLFSSSSTNSLESTFSSFWQHILNKFYPVLYLFDIIESENFFFLAPFVCNWIALMKFLCMPFYFFFFFTNSNNAFHRRSFFLPLIWIDWFDRRKSCISSSVFRSKWMFNVKRFFFFYYEALTTNEYL